MAQNNEIDADAHWRRLALQFDNHRMQALWHLKALLKDPEGHKAAVEKFLSEPPLSGEKVLKQRIKAIAEENKNGGKMDIRKEIFDLLDDRVGCDCNFNDYENKEAILDYAIEFVQEEDDLTQGCGVGPLMGYIQEWVDNFEKAT